MTNPSGEQWRILGPDETIQEGDEFQTGDRWYKSRKGIGKKVGPDTYRRPIPSILEGKKECAITVEHNETGMWQRFVLLDEKRNEICFTPDIPIDHSGMPTQRRLEIHQKLRKAKETAETIAQALTENDTLRTELQTYIDRAILADKRTSEAEEKLQAEQREVQTLKQIIENGKAYTREVEGQADQLRVMKAEAEKERDEARKALEEIQNYCIKTGSLIEAAESACHLQTIANSALNEKGEKG